MFDELNDNAPLAPRLNSTIGWENPTNPLASGEGAVVDTSKSRHASKFADCGAPCIQNINTYYKTDFDILQYPVRIVG